MSEKHWTVEKNNNYSPPWVLRFDPTPGGRKNADGTTTISVSFPALQITDWVADPETSLAGAARALNRDGLFDEMVEALEGVIRIADRQTPEFERARAVITKAKNVASTEARP